MRRRGSGYRTAWHGSWGLLMRRKWWRWLSRTWWVERVEGDIIHFFAISWTSGYVWLKGYYQLIYLESGFPLWDVYTSAIIRRDLFEHINDPNSQVSTQLFDGLCFLLFVSLNLDYWRALSTLLVMSLPWRWNAGLRCKIHSITRPNRRAKAQWQTIISKS